jgi:hypothetical protein
MTKHRKLLTLKLWEDNNRMDLKKIVWDVVWIGFIWLSIRTSGRPL